jgi:hypothetical protein
MVITDLLSLQRFPAFAHLHFPSTPLVQQAPDRHASSGITQSTRHKVPRPFPGGWREPTMVADPPVPVTAGPIRLQCSHW